MLSDAIIIIYFEQYDRVHVYAARNYSTMKIFISTLGILHLSEYLQKCNNWYEGRDKQLSIQDF